MLRQLRFIGSLSVSLLATAIAGCSGGATIGANSPNGPSGTNSPGVVSPTPTPNSGVAGQPTTQPSAQPTMQATSPPAMAPSTPGPGSTAGATPAPNATSAVTARTPASCLAGSTPAPIAAGNALGAGSLYGAWGATVGSAGSNPAPTNGSVRDMAQISLSGTAVRIRLINPDSTNPLVVCSAYIGLQMTNPGPALIPGSTRQITFNNGQPGIKLPPNTPFAYSDPIAFTVKAQQIVGVSLYLSSPTVANAYNATWNSSYATANGAGDATRDESGAAFTADLSGATFDATFGTGQQEDLQGGVTYALAAIDVMTTDANGSIVGLGSSTFQGYESQQDEYDHVLDDLATRVNTELAPGTRKGIVNMGLGGDSLFVALGGRFTRDVLTQTGTTGLMLYDINDMDPQNGQTEPQVEANYKLAVQLAHSRGIRVYCSTWAPESVSDTSEVANMGRSKINAFILNSGTCDDTVDWATTLAQPGVPLSYNPAYFSDSIHANAAGHRAISDAVPLARWFNAGAYRQTSFRR